MSASKGPLRVVLEEMLADGQWHTLDSMMAAWMAALGDERIEELARAGLKYRRRPDAPVKDWGSMRATAARRALNDMTTHASNIELRGLNRTREARLLIDRQRPPAPRGAPSQAGLDFLADGKWHRLEELVEAIGRATPPGPAHREGVRRLARASEEYSTEQVLRSGRRALARTTMKALDLEYDGPPRQRRWVRLRAASTTSSVVEPECAGQDRAPGVEDAAG